MLEPRGDETHCARRHDRRMVVTRAPRRAETARRREWLIPAGLILLSLVPVLAGWVPNRAVAEWVIRTRG